MNKSVRNLYTAALENKEFEQSLSDAGEGHHKPALLTDNKRKIVYAVIYMGGLIGKGLYNESDYN